MLDITYRNGANQVLVDGDWKAAENEPRAVRRAIQNRRRTVRQDARGTSQRAHACVNRASGEPSMKKLLTTTLLQ